VGYNNPPVPWRELEAALQRDNDSAGFGVTRQALEERVRPVLYINKIDRLIKELRLNPDQMQKWLFNIGALFFDLEYARFWLVVLLVPILAAVSSLYSLGSNGL